MAANFLKTLQALSSEKQAVRKREEKLVADLRGVLGKLGYRLEPMSGNGAARRGTRATTRRAVPTGSKPLTCPECGRSFALPLHLGRHMSTMHKAKPAASSQTKAAPAADNGSSTEGVAKPTARRRMSPAARRAAARRMKAYWRQRKAATRRSKTAKTTK